MSLELRRKESVPEGIKRIVAERIEDSLKALHRKTGSSDEEVHTVRKQLKEVRAAVRLVRYDLGEDLFRQENAAFRDATRSLSEVRDAAVMIKTLDQLLHHSSGEIRPETFESLREALRERRREIRRDALGPPHAIERIAATLQEALARAGKWPIKHNGWKALKTGLRRSYEQSREAMAEALQDGSDETMHEWRKRVKYQRHHLDMLRNTWRKVMEPTADQAHTLSGLLGQHHDLVVLKSLADGELKDTLEKKQHETLQALIAERQERLQNKAAKLGRRLCAENGKEFISRIHRYWQAWR